MPLGLTILPSIWQEPSTSHHVWPETLLRKATPHVLNRLRMDRTMGEAYELVSAHSKKRAELIKAQ